MTGWTDVIIARRLALTQPGVLVALVRRRLLSAVALREMLGMAPARGEAETAHTEQLMRHDAHRRHKGRMVQTRWSAPH